VDSPIRTVDDKEPNGK